jgi:ATP synthase protein I
MMNSNLIGKRSDRAKARYFTVLKYQSGILLVFSAAVAFIDFIAAYSMLIGGLIYLIPNTYFANRHFKKQTKRSAQGTLAELYASQIWKMALMVISFSLAFVLVKPISVFSLFAMLILLQVSNLIMQFSVKTDS